jgi:maltose alpha-D-glucosyltransferase/alpha-amylase
MDPVYGFQSINVEAQQRNPHSLLHWVRSLIAVRKTHPVFGTGSFRALETSNPKVLAFLRGERNPLLVVANLGATSQPVELDLQEYAGHIPVEMLGRTPFPPIGDLPYLLTVGPHFFYWFELNEELPSD